MGKGVEPETIIDSDSYMNRTEAAEFLGVSIATLQRFENAGDLKPYKEKSGGKRARTCYREGDVFALRKSGRSDAENDLMLAPAEIVKNAAKAMADANSHTKTMLAPIQSMYEMLLSQSQKQIESLQARCSHLEKETFKYIDQRKALELDNASASILEEREKAGIEFKREAFGKLLGYAPLLATLIGDKYTSGNTQTNIRASALVDIIDNMDVPQIEALQKSGAFGQGEMATIINMKDRLLAERQKRLTAEAEADADPDTNGAGADA